VQLEDEEQEAVQPQEHELGQEPDPAHAEPEAAKPAEAHQEADAEQAEADAGRAVKTRRTNPTFFFPRN